MMITCLLIFIKYHQFLYLINLSALVNLHFIIYICLFHFHNLYIFIKIFLYYLYLNLFLFIVLKFFFINNFATTLLIILITQIKD